MHAGACVRRQEWGSVDVSDGGRGTGPSAALARLVRSSAATGQHHGPSSVRSDGVTSVLLSTLLLSSLDVRNVLSRSPGTANYCGQLLRKLDQNAGGLQRSVSHLRASQRGAMR